MREIKFRGKRKDNGEWVYGFLVYNNTNEVYIIDEKFKFSIQTDYSADIYGVYEVIPETVGQYVGFVDENGREIYEKDIIKRLSDVFDDDERVAVIEWDDNTASFVFSDKNGKHWINMKSDIDKNIEVIE